uniref:Diguanylate cyclase/phosphodiesterase (GGDEF & EAL domains) with PAS/PAC sensor(S) n=1 Tax=Rheinheimera sp. BAL341 TaxID=1708203 RepID=A0A486XWT7_9GAMM
MCADGSVVWARLSVALVQHNTTAYFISVVQDITAQRLTQLQLEQSELRFRTLLDITTAKLLSRPLWASVCTLIMLKTVRI